MKKLCILMAAAVMLMSFSLVSHSPNRSAPDRDDSQKNPVIIYSSPDLFELASAWAESYSAANMQAKVEVSIINEAASEKQKIPQNKLTIVSDYEEKEFCSNSPWRMLIGRDPVVPVISNSNPNLQMINKLGISSGECSEILNSESKLTWGDLLDGNTNKTLEVYLENEPSVLATMSQFTGTGVNSLSAGRFNKHSELLSILNSKPGAVAFVRLSSILNRENNEIEGNISIVPFDVNENGTIDSFENIYGSSQSLLRGAWLGKYPRSLVQNLYILAGAVPSEENEIAFLNYLAVNGQELLAGTGFSGLVNGEIQTVIDKLKQPLVPDELVMVSNKGNIVIIIISIALLLLLAPAVVVGIKNRSYSTRKTVIERKDKIFTPEILVTPQGLLFDKSHTWTFMEKNGRVRIGIDDFLQHITGPLTRVNLLNPGDKVRKGEKIIILSNKGKQIAVKSPVTGTIIEQNPALNSNPSNVNTLPYSEGWMYLIEPLNWQSETDKMMMAAGYGDWVKTEFTRLKDFLSNSVQANQIRYTPAILNDGGEILDNALDLLGSEAWEDFQNQFID